MARTTPQAKPVWLILVDDFHLQFKSTGYLRRLVSAIVTDLIQDGEELAIDTSSTRIASVARTTEREQLARFVRDISGMGLRQDDMASALPAELELRERLMQEAAFRLLDSGAEHKDRGARMIVISNGWRTGPDGVSVQAVVTRAKSVGASIVAIDPEQLVRTREPIAPADPTAAALLAATAASLRAVAERTGGMAILDSRELPEVLGIVRKAFKLPGNPV